ncbi:protein FAM227A-like [Watersipora subatra]|uniref:protein FAM227A-like n=1 Tax=Watersipora subatra TaxID=2589382 RepID=UPI00355B65C9
MATNMAVRNYNAIASPMHLFEDGELLTREELRKRKEEALIKQEKKSPFLVGTMAQVNERIGELDRSLQDYTQLVFDSRMSENDETAIVLPFSPGSSLASAKQRRKVKSEAEQANEEREAAEIKAFSGIYSIHSAVGQAPERIKNVHKITMRQKKKERKKSAESSGVKPKFVELFTFPGYHSTALTPLPHNITTSEMLNKAIRAQQRDRHKVLAYDEEYNRAVYSHMSQAILQDIYWWIFLEKFSTQKNAQPLFFNRVSHNYVKFLTHIQPYQYKEAILNCYPELMSQSVYVAFTETFPDSYKQFGDDFKEFLLCTVYEWMTGIILAPRQFLKWSPELEPAGKKREAAMGKAQSKVEAKKAAAADDWLATIDAMSGSIQKSSKKYGSEISLASRATSHNTIRSKHNRGPGSESSRSEDTTHMIDSVAEAQPSRSKYPRPPGASKVLTPVQETITGRLSEPTDLHAALDGIEEERSTVFTRIASKAQEKSFSKRRIKSRSQPSSVRESHPACKGPDMVKSLFDVRGVCPLVSHYMKSQNMETDAGKKINVTRSELKNLPPLDAPTYRDVIKDTFKTIKNIEKGIHKHIKADMTQHSRFVIQQNKRAKSFRETQANLLNDTKEVQRLSNLLILENNADREVTEKGAAKDTSKLDRQFDLALQRAAESKAVKFL